MEVTGIISVLMMILKIMFFPMKFIVASAYPHIACRIMATTVTTSEMNNEFAILRKNPGVSARTRLSVVGFGVISVMLKIVLSVRKLVIIRRYIGISITKPMIISPEDKLN